MVAPPLRRAPAILPVRRLRADRGNAQQSEQVFPRLFERGVGVTQHGFDSVGGRCGHEEASRCKDATVPRGWYEANNNSWGSLPGQAHAAPARVRDARCSRLSRVAYGAGHAPNEAAPSMPRTIPAAARRRSRRPAWCARSAGGQRPARQTDWPRRARSTMRRLQPKMPLHLRWQRDSPIRMRPAWVIGRTRTRTRVSLSRRTATTTTQGRPACLGAALPGRVAPEKRVADDQPGERRPRQGHTLSPGFPTNCSDARGGIGLQHLLDLAVRHGIQPKNTAIEFLQPLVSGRREDDDRRLACIGSPPPVRRVPRPCSVRNSSARGRGYGGHGRHPYNGQEVTEHMVGAAAASMPCARTWCRLSRTRG